jgi:exopolysaccharide transport family protein
MNQNIQPPVQQMQVEEQDEINLQDYLRVLVKRRWIILTSVAIIFFSTLVYCLTVVPTYKGTTRILIERDNGKTMSLQEAFSVDTAGTDYYQTQYEIIKSRTVAKMVLDTMGSELEQLLIPPADDSLLSSITHLPGNILGDITGFFSGPTGNKDNVKVSELSAKKKKEQQLLRAIQNRVVVTPIRNSRLVDIGFMCKDPTLAARVADSIAEAYIACSLNTRLQATQEAMGWLNRRIVKEREKVEEAERQLQRYRENNKIITGFSGEVETVTAQKLAELNSQVVEAESRRVEEETRYAQARRLLSQGKVLESLPEVIRNPLIQGIKKSEVDLYGKLSELSKKYGKNHPQIKAVRSELALLKNRRESEVRQIVDSLKNSYEVALARETSLKSSLQRQKKESLDLNKKAIKYGVLSRQAEGARDMYDILIKRFKEASVAGDINVSNIRIVDRAEIPQSSSKPKKKSIMRRALVLGGMAGVFLAFLIEYFDNSIKLPKDVENFLRIPYLGMIPNIFSRLKKEEKLSAGLITREQPKSVCSEAYRNLRTKIIFSSAGGAPTTILCTSSMPSEGKTITVANLAVTMAQAGSRVIIVDCDMRRPRLHRIMGVKRDRGLSNILVGDSTLAETIHKSHIPNLHIITAGRVPPNPSELLGSDNMAALLKILSEKYDRVLIDSPPVTAVTDAVLLSRMVDSVLLVIRANKTPKKIVKHAIDLIYGVNGHLIGALLNGLEIEKNTYYYQYYYKSAYAYAEDGEKIDLKHT